MKTKYLKEITALGLTAVLFFGSCLKDDKHLFQPLSVQSNLAELPLSGLSNFTRDAITAPGIDTVTFAVGVTAATPPSTATTVVIGVDNALIAPYNAANPAIAYQPIPTAAFKLPVTSVSIPAGQNSTRVTVIIDRNQLDPAQSYMLPVKIVSAPVPISANFGVHYFHIIGNDFAGNYKHDFTRTPPGGDFVGTPSVLSPVSPTQFEVAGGYFTRDVRYEVTFTKTGIGTAARYNNFKIFLNASDITTILTANSISVTVQPSIVGYDPAKNYTFAEAQALFTFQYDVLGGSGARHNVDRYYK